MLKYTLLLVPFLFVLSLSAQTDSIRFSKDQLIVGEIKSMNKGILVVETDYSDDDFKMEWKEVTWIRTETRFFITLARETKYYGRIDMANDSTNRAALFHNKQITFELNDIVYLEKVDDKFVDRFDAEISLGIDMAKARNMRSISSRGLLSYKAEKWATDIALNSLSKKQDDADLIERIDSETNLRYILKNWYVIGSITTLSNTEQNLRLRFNAQGGAGRFIVRSNKTYWGIKLGLNRNLEDYTNETTDRSSWEGFVGTELNVFDAGDLDLLFLTMVYPSITERGRLRSDSRFDIKYDLPLDFFVKLGTSVNYDNRPAEDGSKTDYVLQFTFGWEW